MKFIKYVFRKYPVGIIFVWCVVGCCVFIVYDLSTKGSVEWIIPGCIFGFTLAVTISFLLVEYFQGRKHKPWNM